MVGLALVSVTRLFSIQISGMLPTLSAGALCSKPPTYGRCTPRSFFWGGVVLCVIFQLFSSPRIRIAAPVVPRFTCFSEEINTIDTGEYSCKVVSSFRHMCNFPTLLAYELSKKGSMFKSFF
jgi:hypothetical protein